MYVAEMIENLKNPHDTIRVSALHEQLQGAGGPLVVDTRLPELFAKSTIPGAINIPMEVLAERRDELPEDRDAPIVMVCGIGKFSKNTVLYLKSMGYRNARSMKGGINEWVRKGHPTHSSSSDDGS